MSDDDSNDHPKATRVEFLWEDDGFQGASDGEFTRFAGDVSLSIGESDLEPMTPGFDPGEATREVTFSIDLDPQDSVRLLRWLDDGPMCMLCGAVCADREELEEHMADAHGIEP